ncbi:MAG TPA: diaminopimelate epimerase [Oscillospiraceae bacterium]|nr:diaminopimelate epimerase [Oscillospiraceae bacterium]
MKFTKMQGIGNNYLYFNCFENPIMNPSELSIKLSDVHFGVGSDGIILIEPSEKADCKMDIYNADGSRAMMCGNGIRCVGKYVYERGLVKKDVITVDTRSGVKTLYLDVQNGIVKSVKVNMGEPDLVAKTIPVIFSKDQIIDEPITVDNKEYRITCVSMGNPHCVIFVDDVDRIDLEKIGPKFEFLPIFPERVNTEFVQIISNTEAKMRVWERGSGETWACGTGTCATVVASALNEKTGRKVLVHLNGGALNIDWDEKSNEVFMQGPAEFIFDGTIEI